MSEVLNTGVRWRRPRAKVRTMAMVALTPKALTTIEELERHNPSARGRRAAVVEVALSLYLSRRLNLPDPPSVNRPLPDVGDDWPLKEKPREDRRLGKRTRHTDPIASRRR